MLDQFLTGTGARTEHYEIAAYEGLIRAAQAVGEADVAGLLSENLEQEKEALKTFKKINQRLAREGAKERVTA